MFDISVIRYFRAGRANVADRQLVDVVVAGQSREGFQLFRADSQKILQPSGRLVDLDSRPQLRVLGRDAHWTFSGVADPVLLASAQGERPCSADTGAYCTARGNLPEEAIHQLVRDTGMQADDLADESWLWQGRRVRVVDGSTITMPDTPANQAAYPQQENQKPGCGLPRDRA